MRDEVGEAGVVSLVYLASQIRQNSRLLQASTASVTHQTVTVVSSHLVQDPEVARIYFEGVADRGALSEADRQRFDPLIQLIFAGHQQHFRFARDGIISADVWDDVDQGVRWSRQQPGVQQWWLQWRDTLGGDFREYYDGLIREGEAAG